MTTSTFGIPEKLNKYIIEKGTPPDELLCDLYEETQKLGEESRMQIAHEQGAFMGFLVKLLQPKFCVEVGTFTGYSSICIARQLAADARLLCCDVSQEWTDIAQKYWARAGLTDRITLELGPALETLKQLPDTPQIDFAFIDADKGNYQNYYEIILSKLNPNGAILVDNVLWGGAVVESDINDPNTLAIKEFNEFVAKDKRVQVTILPLADGISLITPL